jgi:hypothetical protein
MIMSTNREFSKASFFRALFPETKWTELLTEDYSQVFQRLRDAGPLGAEAVAFIQAKKVRLGFYEQYKSGAGWTFLRNITLAPGVKLDQPYSLCLIIHEAFHLNQSILERLSMRGELLAWQYQERAYLELTGKRIGESGQAYGGTRRHWDELMLLSADSREDLKKAQEVTRKIAPAYRSYCLPLYPLHNEVGFFLEQRKFKEAFNVVKDLISCK